MVYVAKLILYPQEYPDFFAGFLSLFLHSQAAASRPMAVIDLIDHGSPKLS